MGDQPTLGEACRRWIRFRRADLRAESVRSYSSHLGSLIRAHPPTMPVAHWGRAECEVWWQAQGHLTARTLRHRLSCVHQWATWCVLHDLMATDPTAFLPRVRQPKSVPRALTVEQVEAVWQACPDARSRLCVSLMLHEGFRRGEVARLDWAHLDLGRRRVVVDGKGGHSRTLAVSAATLRLLEAEPYRWGPVVRSKMNPSKSLTPGYIAELVGGVFAAAGVEATGHCLRHTAASDALESGCSIRTVQRFLGHSMVSSTEVYLRADTTDLIATVDGRPYHLTV